MTTSAKFILIGPTEGESGVAAAARRLRDMDLVLLEGKRLSANPKIEVVRNAVNPVTSMPENVIAIITDVAGLKVPVPVFGLDDIQEVVDFILERFFNSQKKEL